MTWQAIQEMLSDPFRSGRSRAGRNVRVQIHKGVLQGSQELIRANPRIEVGGKYVGYVHANGDYLDLLVVDYIDSGPRASRSATSHLPDADYQVRTFRAIEAADPAIQHLGSWHSHHPNGYRRLSTGDIDGYYESVNSENHLPTIFLASLAIDAHGLEAASHFVFVKGAQEYFTLPRERVTVVPGNRRFHPLTSTEGLSPATHDRVDWRSSAQARDLIAGLNKALAGHFTGLTTVTRGAGELVWRGAMQLPEPVVAFEVVLSSQTLLTIRVDRSHDCITYAFDPQNGDVDLPDVPHVVNTLLALRVAAPTHPETGHDGHNDGAAAGDDGSSETQAGLG